MAPLTQEHTLASGRVARFEMPDMIAFADGSFDIPNQAQADIFELIYGGNFSVDPMKQLGFDRRKLHGLYALASIVIAEPKVVLDPEDATGDALFYRSLAWGDVLAAHAFFRYGPPYSLPVTAPEKPGVGEKAAPAAPPSE